MDGVCITIAGLVTMAIHARGTPIVMAFVDETFAPTVKQEPHVGMMTIAPMAGACMIFAGLGTMVMFARGIQTATVTGVTGLANPGLTGATAATKTVIVSPTIVVAISGTGD